MITSLLSLMLAGAAIFCVAQQDSTPAYKNPQLSLRIERAIWKSV
jgi:hypothetical protein